MPKRLTQKGKSSDKFKMVKQYRLWAEKLEGLGEVLRVERPFDECMKILKNQGATPISARDSAYVRIKNQEQAPALDSVSSGGNYVREGMIFTPDKTIFVRNSPFLDESVARDAVREHGYGRDFCINDFSVKRYLRLAEIDKDRPSTEKRALALDRIYRDIEIHPDFLCQSEIGLFLFGDQAEKYGDLFRKRNEERIMDNFIIYDSIGSTKKSYARQLWMYDIDNSLRGSMSVSEPALHMEDGILGVRDVSRSS